MPIAHVMIADDERDFVETLCERLDWRELKIVKAFSGEEALKALESDNTIEVVILDVSMPNMDGIETLRQIKTKHPVVEVIMLTGHATVETAIEGMKLGAFDYLIKPCDMEVLISKISNAAARKREHEMKILQAYMKEVLRTGRIKRPSK